MKAPELRDAPVAAHVCASGTDWAHCAACGELMPVPAAARATLLARAATAAAWQRGGGTPEGHRAASEANRDAAAAHERARRAAPTVAEGRLHEASAKDHAARVRFHDRAAVAARLGISLTPKAVR